MRNRILVTLAISLLAPCLHAPAQDSAQSAATIKIKVNEVVLPVIVRDKHGALVTSLKASDFTLTEDTRPQVIKSFTRESNLPYKMGLLVDTSRSLSEALESERKAAGNFVDKMLPATPNAVPDQMFLIHFDREVELLEDFTTAREKLHHELEEMGPTRQGQNDSQGPETSRDDRDHSRGGKGGTQLYDAIYLASDELMRSQTGRKALVVFSDGVDRGSKDTLNDAVDAADRANVVVYTIYFKGEQEHGGGMPGMGGGHHGGGGYPGGGGGYPGGSGGGGGRDEKKEAADGKKTMTEIATRTGGRFFEAKNKGNLDEIYAQIAEELRGQYLLTYTPDKPDTEGGYHKIALKANNDSMVVVTREGYYGSLDK